jgi:transposase
LQAIGKSRAGWTTKIHLLTKTNREPIAISLSAGNADDATEGRWLLEGIGPIEHTAALLMDKAYSNTETRHVASCLNFRPVVPPKKDRKVPWCFDGEEKELYKQRNEIERAFRRLKEFRRIFTRYDKLDIMFTAFVHLALICIISLV